MSEKDFMTDGESIQLETRDSILNNLSTAIYVSDIETNIILYVNTAMRQMCGGRRIEGMVCWEALENATQRCSSCAIPYLLKHPGKYYQHEVYNGKHLKIYDNIIPWGTGRMAHMRHIADITREYSMR